MAKRLQVPKKSQVNRDDSADNLVWKQRLRAYALKPLLPIPAMPNKAELSRMFIQEGGRFLQMMKPNTVRVWMYNRKTLTGLLYGPALMKKRNKRGRAYQPRLNRRLLRSLL